VVDTGGFMLDILSPFVARGAQQKTQLLLQAGGTRSTGEVCTLLGVSIDALDQQRRDGQLLAIPQGDDYAYPVCQFVADRVVPGLAEVLQEIGLDHPWAALAFLITPDDRLDQLSPLDALRGADQRLKELTVRIARVTAGEDFG
jgi:hypothetical protein